MATKERLIIESLLCIPDKHSDRDLPFVLNSAQAALDARLTGRDIIPKSRQRGISSYFLARYLVKCLSERNTRAVVISHEKESTQRMLARVHYYINTIRGPKPVIKNASKNELTFPKTNSMFYIGTAGAKKFGRGDTITHLHCSEVAYWEDPESLTKGLFQAVPEHGEIAIESTGNGVGNWYHRHAMRAVSGHSRYRLHFFGWLDDPDCWRDCTPEEAAHIMANLDPDLEEPELVERFNVRPEQIKFRREKLEEMDFDLRGFKQEYPSTLDECFQATGSSIFHKVHFVPTDRWQRDGNFWFLEGHPNPRRRYIIGADVGGGVERDNSVAEIIDLETLEQVGEWVSNRVAPDDFAHVLKRLAELFNDAYVVPESNNHGILTIATLKRVYKPWLIFKHKLDGDRLSDEGVKTTARSKPLIVGKLRSALAAGLVIHSELLRNELSTFVEKDDGKLEAEEGCYDDRVIALAMAVYGRDKAAIMLQEPPPPRVEVVDPFSLEAIIKELRERKQGGSPISSHVILH